MQIDVFYLIVKAGCETHIQMGNCGLDEHNLKKGSKVTDKNLSRNPHLERERLLSAAGRPLLTVTIESCCAERSTDYKWGRREGEAAPGSPSAQPWWGRRPGAMPGPEVQSVPGWVQGGLLEAERPEGERGDGGQVGLDPEGPMCHS